MEKLIEKLQWELHSMAVKRYPRMKLDEWNFDGFKYEDGYYVILHSQRKGWDNSGDLEFWETLIDPDDVNIGELTE